MLSRRNIAQRPPLKFKGNVRAAQKTSLAPRGLIVLGKITNLEGENPKGGAWRPQAK